jgi:hypothetical protein
MDWSVIIDGFVLFMALVSLALLAYGLTLAIEYQRPAADRAEPDGTYFPAVPEGIDAQSLVAEYGPTQPNGGCDES